MGQTLENGVYLPSEGERNCYAGLKTNWEILDQKVADVTALQQAVAGALHREIVESLPTTDIDPNTIYMILSGTSATENVYNEFMYVNNAWELIGTSATDLTNYYTKGEVDGLLLLKANASDLTSHTGDTTIHVTASDKAKWDTVALIKQLRLVNTQVGSATTIAFANIDDTNGIKAGDKCMDLDAKMFEITAVDTTNQTVTVGTALIDLAQDSDVVHKSGNETITGYKIFSDNMSLYNSSASVNPVALFLKNKKVVMGSTTDIGSQNIAFRDSADTNLTILKTSCESVGNTSFEIRTYNKDSNNQTVSGGMLISQTSANTYITPTTDNSVLFGSTSKKWSKIYGTEYYYGSNNVEFSTKFVTTDTNQTISGNKTFSSNAYIYNSDNTATTPNLYLRSSKIEISSQGNTSGDQNLTYSDRNNTTYAYVKGAVQSNGSAVKIRTIAKDSSDNSVVNELQMLAGTNGNKSVFPSYSNEIDLGTSSYKWKSFNGLTPSSLSLPDFSNRVDITSYISNLTGATNNYAPSVNGWIYVGSNDASYLALFDTGSGGCGIRFSDGVVGEKYACIPCIASRTLGVRITCTNLAHAYFIPCQGNV